MTAHPRGAAALLPLVPHLTRRSLAADVADLLRAYLREKRWRTRLPGERALAQALHISRGTLRAALATLEREGTLRAAPGSGRDIVLSRRTRARQRSRSVGLLLPGALQEMRPTLVLWVEALRSELFDAGTRLVVHEGERLYSGNVGSSLTRFISANPNDCWILVLSTPSIQRWFAEHRQPCLVAGSCHPGVDLPSIDLDHAGIGRHAAGMFLAHGHRRVALLSARPRTAGDHVLADAFTHAFAASGHDDAEAREIIHEPDVP